MRNKLLYERDPDDELRNFEAILVTREWLDAQRKDLAPDVYRHALENLTASNASGLDLYFIRATYRGRALAYYQTLSMSSVPGGRSLSVDGRMGAVLGVLRGIVLDWARENYPGN